MHIVTIFVGNHTHNVKAGIDYYTAIAFPYFDIIPAYTRHYTLNVGIVPDHILEDDELFQVTPRPKHIPDGYATNYFSVDVIIRDDDGNFNINVV